MLGVSLFGASSFLLSLEVFFPKINRFPVLAFSFSPKTLKNLVFPDPGFPFIEIKLPENYPQNESANKKAIFNCKILSIKKPESVEVNDDFAKGLGAKDLKNLRELISKQINEEYKNSLGMITKKDILLLISNSGDTNELKNIIQYANRNKILLIGIVSKKDSTLYKASDIKLLTPQVKESGGIIPTSSTTVQLALGLSLIHI